MGISSNSGTLGNREMSSDSYGISRVPIKDYTGIILRNISVTEVATSQDPEPQTLHSGR